MARGPKKLDELFHETLKDIYFAEKKILSALPKLAKAAQHRKLQAAFEKHHAETETHVSRLEQVFSAIDAKPQGKTCDAILGIVEEGQEIMKEYKGLPRLGCRPCCGSSSGGTLRNLTLRHASYVGGGTGPAGRREAPGGDAARGESNRRGAVADCRNGREPGCPGSGCGLNLVVRTRGTAGQRSFVSPITDKRWRC